MDVICRNEIVEQAKAAVHTLPIATAAATFASAGRPIGIGKKVAHPIGSEAYSNEHRLFHIRGMAAFKGQVPFVVKLFAIYLFNAPDTGKFNGHRSHQYFFTHNEPQAAIHHGGYRVTYGIKETITGREQLRIT